MSATSISIVPKQSTYINKEEKVLEVLHWLISEDIIKPNLSDSVFSSELGYAISEGAKTVTNNPEYLPFDTIPNGLDIVLERSVFHSNEIEECICPNCKLNIAVQIWDFFDDWALNKSDNVICPLCKNVSEINQFQFSPEWGFSDFGFIFWNWQEFKEEFIQRFRKTLDCEIVVVDCHH